MNTGILGLVFLFFPLTSRGGVQIGLSAASFSNRTWQGVAPQAQTLMLSQAGGDPESVDYSVSSDAAWLELLPLSGHFSAHSGQADVTLSYRTASLGFGSYTGRITVMSSVATNVPLVCTARVEVLASRRVYGVDPATQTVTMVVGSTTHVARTLAVWNAATPGQAETLSWTLTSSSDWIAMPSPSGSSAGAPVIHTLVLTNLADFPVGNYTGRVDVVDAGAAASNSPARATVVLQVVQTPPRARLSTNRVELTVTQGVGVVYASINVHNAGDGDLDFQFRSYKNWLTLSPTSGTARVEQPVGVTVAINTDLLPPGYQYGYADLILPGNANDSDDDGLAVSLNVVPAAYLLNCSGSVTGLAVAGSSMVVTQQVRTWNAGQNNPIYYTTEIMIAPSEHWLSITPTNGYCSHYRPWHDVLMTAADLPEGEYAGTINFRATNASTMATCSAFLRVASDIRAAPLPVESSAQEFEPTGDATLRIWNNGSTNPVAYSLSEKLFWLSLSATNGTSSGETNLITVTFDTAGLLAGVYKGTIQLEAYHQRLDIPVALKIGDALGEFEERIVFSMRTNGAAYSAIYSMRPDGSDKKILLADNEQDVDVPVVRPDGKSFFYRNPHYYATYDLASGYSVTELPYGNELRWLTADGELFFFSGGYWGADFSAVRYHPGDSGTECFAGRGLATYLANDTQNHILYYTIGAWQGDSQDIWAWNYNENTHTKVATDLSGQRSKGDMLPGGRQIIYSYYLPYGGTAIDRQLRAFNLDTGVETSIIASDQYGYITPTLSPDGTTVAAIRFLPSEHDYHLVLVDIATGTDTLLVSGVNSNSIGTPNWGMIYVVAPELAVNKTSMSNSAVLKSSTVLSDTFTVRNVGNSALHYSITSNVEWVYFDPPAGTSTGETDTVQLFINSYDLPEGLHTGIVTIAGQNAASNHEIQVFMAVNLAPPVPTMYEELTASALTGTLSTVLHVPLWNEGGRKYYYTAATNQPWLRLLSGFGGWCSNDVEEIRVQLRTTDIPLGTHTGIVSVTTSYSISTTVQTRIVLTVTNVTPVAPTPELLPANATYTIHQYESLRFSTCTVRNATGSAPMSYYITADADWLRVRPESDATNPRSCNHVPEKNYVWYDTESLPQGTHEATLTVHTTNGNAQARVTVNVLPPATYQITLVPTEAGTLSITPHQPDGYAYSSIVTARAESAVTHSFDHWLGPVASPNQSRTRVTVLGDTTLEAVFRERLSLHGYITNAITGKGIPGAEIMVGNKKTSADSTGYYAILLDYPGLTFCWPRKKGYEDTAFTKVDIADGVNRADFALIQQHLTYFKASQHAGTRLIKFNYTLIVSRMNASTYNSKCARSVSPPG